MISEKDIQLITDMANAEIKKRCPQVEYAVKTYITKAVLEAVEKYMKLEKVARMKYASSKR